MSTFAGSTGCTALEAQLRQAGWGDAAGSTSPGSAPAAPTLMSTGMTQAVPTHIAPTVLQASCNVWFDVRPCRRDWLETKMTCPRLVHFKHPCSLPSPHVSG